MIISLYILFSPCRLSKLVKTNPAAPDFPGVLKAFNDSKRSQTPTGLRKPVN